jgi:competence ComEA-like helix-hairpin-helix protein
MSPERLDFGRRAPGPGWGRLLPMGALLVLVGGALGWRLLGPSAPPPGVRVEVRGDVPSPGWHRVEPPTVRAALEAAGVMGEGSGAPLHEGDRVRRTEEGVTVHPAGNPLLVALPVDLNEAGPEALQAVPGLGETLARAIVADRARRGPFYAVRDLARVRGIGPGTVEELAPLLTVGDVGPRPSPKVVDVNTADAATLETLPGIGPVLAARIVVDRDERGPYRSLEALDRVPGVGPGILAGLRGRAVAGSRVDGEEAPAPGTDTDPPDTDAAVGAGR